MCGIAGVVTIGRLTDLRTAVQRMCDAQAHRGPDDSGVTAFRAEGLSVQAAIGSRRLSILDLSAAGHQPMENEDGSLAVVFNGEIYNFAQLRDQLSRYGHAFRSRSDTEVLLRGYEQWGIAGLLPRLNGMFAFAIWDVRKQRLVIARDRLGEKPLYYAWDGKSFVFASELTALLASGLVERRLNPAAALAYLMMGSVPAPLTMIDGVAALPPGHVLVLEDTHLSVEPYWRLEFTENPRIGAAEAAEEVLRLLRDAVSSRLVSDVPVGIFLSGGIDSSAMVALAREATNGTLRTYSLTFREAEYSEAPFAEIVARKFGSEHVAEEMTAGELRDELPKIIRAMDQPTVDGVNTYFVSKLTRRCGTVVALSGIGGDELFGGYSTFRSIPRLCWLAKWLGPLVTAGGKAASSAPQWLRWRSFDKLVDFSKSPRSLAAAYLAARAVFPPGTAVELLDPDFAAASGERLDPLGYLSSCMPSGTPCAENQVSGLELRVYLQNQLLRDTDVMSMVHSLEVRAPLLDHRLVEFVASVPASIKFARRPKDLMLRALGNRLPDEVVARPKRGFLFPFDQWLRSSLRAEMEELLTSEDRGGYFCPKAALTLWQNFLDGRVHWSHVWALATLRLWIERALCGGTLAQACHV
jgi:asparagine synthase (glutamine-hydrolysing)